MTQVRQDLDSRITEGGYTRQKDTPSGARYTKNGNTIIVSGPQVLVCSGGMWQPFEIERAIKLGTCMMERIARMDKVDREYTNGLANGWTLWIDKLGVGNRT